MWLDDGQTTWAVLGVEETDGAVRLITDALARLPVKVTHGLG